MDGDPEDWPSDPEQLRQLDRSLRCQICGDIYTGPVALVCGHSFCSRCIRDSFNVRIKEGQTPVCPSCRTGCDQADLRPVTYLREASNAWRAVRQLLLQAHAQLQQPRQELPSIDHPPQQQQVQQQAAPPQQHSGQGPSRMRRAQAMAAAGRQQQLLHHAAAGNSGSRPHSSVPCNDSDAITVSSNGEANSQDEDACMSLESEREAGDAAADDADVDNAVDDPDWENEEDEEQPQQQLQRGCTRNSRARSQPPVAGTKRRLGHSDSSSGGRAARAALSSSPYDAAAAGTGADAAADLGTSSGDDFELQQQPAKRPRSGQRTGKQDVQQQPDAAPKQQQQQPGKQVQVPPGCVACPICGLSVREAFINSHVDTCLTRGGSGAVVGVQQQQHTPAGSPPPAADSGVAAVHGKQPKQQQQQQHKAAAASKSLQQISAGSAAAAFSRDSVRGSAAAAAVAQPGRASSNSSSRGKGDVVLEAPPKLCFELLKERDLKAKLAGLGLSNDGTKKSCVDRYTAFRNYVLALKDSGATNVSLAAAAADFTKQQKRYARAAARGGGLGALAAAAGTPVVAATGTAGVGTGREQQAEGWVRELGAVDNSYAALIQQTKQRMQQKRQRQQQEPKQQQQQEHDDEQQQQQSDGQKRQPLTSQQPNQEQQLQQPELLETEKQQEWQSSSVEQGIAVQAQPVCGVQRQGSNCQAALAAAAAGKQVLMQPCSKVAELQQQQQLLVQRQMHPGVVVFSPESDEEL